MSRASPDSPSPGGGSGRFVFAPQDDGARPAPDLRDLPDPANDPRGHFGLLQVMAEPTDTTSIVETPNWPVAIELIRDVGARIRQARRFARDVVEHSQAVINATTLRLEETERRLRLAETAARDALLRAERAEMAAALADARARRAEEETEFNRAKLAEAQMWLERLHHSVQIEFADLCDDHI